jgi:hypothetical protein
MFEYEKLREQSRHASLAAYLWITASLSIHPHPTPLGKDPYLQRWWMRGYVTSHLDLAVRGLARSNHGGCSDVADPSRLSVTFRAERCIPEGGAGKSRPSISYYTACDCQSNHTCVFCSILLGMREKILAVTSRRFINAIAFPPN